MHRPLYDRRVPPAAGGLSRVPAGLKLAAALSTVALAASVRSWPILATLAVAVLVSAIASRLPWRAAVKRLLWFEPLALAVAVPALMRPGGGGVFLLMAARVTLGLLTMLVLTHTTPFDDLISVLRRLRFPAALLATLSLTYRFLHVLDDESTRMRRARASRCFTPGRRFAWRGAAGVVGQLFVRAAARAERTHAAMCARGWA